MINNKYSMEESVIQALSASLSPGNEERKKAEDFLVNIKTTQGLIPILIKISLGDLQLEIKQQAVIYLKNLTRV